MPLASDGAVDMAVTYSMAGVSLFMPVQLLARHLMNLTSGVSAYSCWTYHWYRLPSPKAERMLVYVQQAKSNDVGVQYTLPGNGLKLAALSASGTGRDGTTKNRSQQLWCQLPDCAWCKSLTLSLVCLQITGR